MNAPDLNRLMPAHVRSFTAYTPSRPDPVLCRMYGVNHLHRLNNNENVLGPCPAARKVIAEFEPERAAIYPSGDSYLLREELGRVHGLSPDAFLVGNGSCEVISCVIKAFCEQGDNIITADKTFAVYEWVAQFSGIEARLTPLRDMSFDPQAMLDAIDERTKVLFVCNPNNPTGSYWDRATLEEFLDRVGGERIVVLDEAYFEYVDDPEYPDGLKLLERHPNLIVFRTFSKMFGLAALRVGWLCASLDVANCARLTQIAYSVNTLAQAAALASLREPGSLIPDTRRMVREGRKLLHDRLGKAGLEVVSGPCNYVMLRSDVSDTLLYRKLMRQGYMVRTMSGFRFPGWIRISLVSREVLDGLCDELLSILDRS